MRITMDTSSAFLFLIVSYSNLAASVLSRVAEDESIQVKNVLNHLSDTECDKIMVASTYIHGKLNWIRIWISTDAFNKVFQSSLLSKF